MTSIEQSAFDGCKGITSITIPNSVTSIGQSAFANCSNLTSIVIPNSVTSIGNSAFQACTSLSSIDVPNSVTSIGNSAFQACTSLTSIIIPNSVTSISSSVFDGCTSLTSIVVPNSVTSISSSAFFGCSGLTTVIIPNSVTYIGGWAFRDCKNLASVTLPNSLPGIEQCVFFGCSALETIELPNSLNYISSAAFKNCTSLTSVNIPKSVGTIGESAFDGCSNLNSVIIESSGYIVFSYAFANCKKLETFTSYATKVPNTSSHVFQDSFVNYATLIVPAEALKAYKAQAPWSEFGTFKAIDGSIPEEPETKKCSNPTIAYANGKLIYHTDTDGAEVNSEVKVADAKKSYTLEVPLTATYEITAYATKSGYDNSDVVTATLVWVDAKLTSDASDIQSVMARPILVSSNDGNVTITGLEDNERVDVYSISGAKLNSVKSIFGTASFSADKGNTLIVKIVDRSIKVVVK